MSLATAMPALSLLAALVLMINVGSAPSFSFHGGNLTYAFAEIRIANGSFDPPLVCIYRNATVVWVNPGPGEHAICVGDDVSPPLLAGESYTKNFHEFGTFDYYCRYHPGERGKVIVR